MSKRIKLESPIDGPWGRLFPCLPQLDSIDLVEPHISLGRGGDCDIVIHKSKFLPNQVFFISKKQFVIGKDNEDKCIAYITDLSKNGTYVNNLLIGRDNRIILQHNDVIAVGEKLQVYVYKSMNNTDDIYLPAHLKSKYVISRLLGKGACGEVRLAYDKITCQKYAIKSIVTGRDTSSQMHNINHPSRIATEIKILQSLHHPLTISMKEVDQSEDRIFIVLEYVKGGELSTKLKASKLSEGNAKFYFYQMVLAVQYLHSKGITHRDLKPGNVLLTSTEPYSLIKLTDFGLSKISDTMNTTCGTYQFMAPEIINPTVRNYDNQVDVWSLGVILFCMLSKSLPFQSKDRTTLLKSILLGKYSMNSRAWYDVSTEAKDLIKKILQVNPSNRITIDRILTHPWIQKDNLMQFTVEKLIRCSRETT